MPWVVAFVFGLLHGLGFAGALAEIGLPQKAIPLALLCFNVGVELGQLLFRRRRARSGPRPARAARRPASGAALGSAVCDRRGGEFWMVERVAAFWA